VLEKVVREANITPGFTLVRTTIGLFVYADDFAIIGNSLENVKSSGQKLIKIAEKVGLQINDDKTDI